MAETDTPTWLNISFFETALRSGGYGPSVTVTSCQIGRATVAGDNYICDIYRAKLQVALEGRLSSVTLIVKSQPAKGEMFKKVLESDLFEREAGALKTTMPAVYRLLDEKSPGQFQPFTAKCLYYHSGSPAYALVLDDLKEKGFRMADRTVGLDMQHCLLVMKTLAQSHAASAVLHLNDPEIFKLFYESFFCERQRNTVGPVYHNIVSCLAKEVENWPVYKDKFASKLRIAADIAMDIIIKDLERKDDDFNVLIHGDLWLNNMMFRYCDDTAEVVDVRFVDYQLCHFGNPAQDLHYFLHSGPSINLLDKHSVLVEEYHKTLHSTLTLLGHAELCPPLRQIHKQLDKLGRFAVLTASIFLPFFLADPNNIPDLDSLTTKEQPFPFSERYKDYFKILLPYFEQKGWLEFEIV